MVDMNMDIDETIGVTFAESHFPEVRELMYQTINLGFFSPPSVELLKAIIEEQLFESLPLEIKREGFQQGRALLRAWFASLDERNLEDRVAQLNEDYNKLFVDPCQLLAPPWESVYRTEERATADLTTLKVREFYGRHGLAYVLKHKEPEDHYSVELEFMAELIRRQSYYLRTGIVKEALYLFKEQQRFLEEHLLKWSLDFTLSVIQNAHTEYFQGMALLAHEFLMWDYDLLTRKGS